MLNREVEKKIRDHDTQLEQNKIELTDKINEVATTGTTTEVLKNTTETYIQEKINDGTIANLTIKKDSITKDKLAFNVITGTVGKNLFNKNTVVESHYISPNTGNLIASDGYCASDFIKINENEKITIRYSGQGAFYDSNGNFISGITTSDSPQTLISPTSCKYLRITTSNENIAIQQIEKGELFTEFEEYSLIVDDNSVGKNSIKNKCIPIEKLDFTPIVGIKSKNLFDKTKVTDGYYVTPNGGIIENGNYCISDYIEVVPNSKYTIKYINQGVMYNSDKEVIPGSGFDTLSSNTITTTINAKYIRMSVEKSKKDTQQIEVGETLSEYEDAFTKIQFENLGEANLNKIKDYVILERDYSNYLKQIINHLNNPFIKTQIKLVGDSITAGEGGTGFSATGTPIGNTGYKSNVLTATCWANMLYKNITDNWNKETYVEMNNENIKYSSSFNFILNRDTATCLKSYVQLDNTTINKGIEFTFYGNYLSIFYIKDNSSGIFDIYVDNNKIDSVDCFNQTVLYNQEKRIEGLELKNHTVKILETNDKNINSDGKTIKIEALKIFKYATVKNYGISGSTSLTTYTQKENLFEENDNFIFIQYGTNDRNFESLKTTKIYLLEAYNYITKNLKAKVIFMSANPAGILNEQSNKFKQYEVDIIIEELSSQIGIPYISNYDAFIKYEKETGISFVDMLEGENEYGLHPNDLGHKVMYENICRNIGLSILRSGIR